MFVDQIRIQAKAGDGGSGCCSFRREKFVPKGGPDGGDGGRGGDIILRADVQTDNLTALYYDPLLRAKFGVGGKGAKKHGKSAPHTIVPVPLGTLVYQTEAPGKPVVSVDEEDFDAPKEKKKRVTTDGLEAVADLSEPGQEFILTKGGEGGRGNVHFKSSRNRVPIQYTKGDKGQEGWFILELRTIADVGLVGYPNAGKSTLLGAISAAHPKVASYPFTTLHPFVGIVELSEYHRIAVADIPGLIEGAHRNIGLGHEFLKHITRCPFLLFVVDMAGSEGRNPIEDLQHLREELNLYDATLSKREWAIVANKMDIEGAKDNLKAFKTRFKKVPIIPASMQDKVGVKEIKALLEKEFPSQYATSSLEA
ncbi:MAG: GTPase ObgE [Chthoniobacterales bacterium]